METYTYHSGCEKTARGLGATNTTPKTTTPHATLSLDDWTPLHHIEEDAPDHEAFFQAFCRRGNGQLPLHLVPDPSGFRVFICMGQNEKVVGDSIGTP
jgi:hypothetical protein